MQVSPVVFVQWCRDVCRELVDSSDKLLARIDALQGVVRDMGHSGMLHMCSSDNTIVRHYALQFFQCFDMLLAAVPAPPGHGDAPYTPPYAKLDAKTDLQGSRPMPVYTLELCKSIAEDFCAQFGEPTGPLAPVCQQGAYIVLYIFWMQHVQCLAANVLAQTQVANDNLTASLRHFYEQLHNKECIAYADELGSLQALLKKTSADLYRHRTYTEGILSAIHALSKHDSPAYIVQICQCVATSASDERKNYPRCCHHGARNAFHTA